MNRAYLDAAVDLAESDQRGLDQSGLNLEDSKKVLAELVNRRRLSIDELLRRISSSEFAKELLNELFDRVSFAEHSLVASSLVIQEDIWSFDARYATESWFWTTQVYWRISTRDYRRAWEELKQTSNSQPFLDNFLSDPGTRKLAHLVSSLYYAMHGLGLVKTMESDLLELKSNREMRMISERAHSKADHLGRVREPRIYESATKRAGWDLACRFRVQKAGWVEGKGYRHDIFDRTGQMILILARYFSDQRNRRRNENLKRVVNARQV